MFYSNRDPFGDVPQIDPTTAKELWESGDADVLDVREEDEWNLGHIEGVKWIPLGQLQFRWRELDPERKLVCVCRMGSRSQYAAALLRQAGIDASNMEGGMLYWKAEGLPITEPGIVDEH